MSTMMANSVPAEPLEWHAYDFTKLLARYPGPVVAAASSVPPAPPAPPVPQLQQKQELAAACLWSRWGQLLQQLYGVRTVLLATDDHSGEVVRRLQSETQLNWLYLDYDRQQFRKRAWMEFRSDLDENAPFSLAAELALLSEAQAPPAIRGCASPVHALPLTGVAVTGVAGGWRGGGWRGCDGRGGGWRGGARSSSWATSARTPRDRYTTGWSRPRAPPRCHRSSPSMGTGCAAASPTSAPSSRSAAAAASCASASTRTASPLAESSSSSTAAERPPGYPRLAPHIGWGTLAGPWAESFSSSTADADTRMRLLPDATAARRLTRSDATKP